MMKKIHTITKKIPPARGHPSLSLENRAIPKATRHEIKKARQRPRATEVSKKPIACPFVLNRCTTGGFQSFVISL